ncbi:Energy-coupling factor transporter ATP-binding protein EcfA2 [Pseudomonas syringae pv. actinidiae]|uniref:Energy-coupling factor transporter ATP-binding protein EcfA2 n=1 Tax=Pseudomonas syringae pv. actinidiae TaxID=103796 RepID=A0A2V0QLU0_PSESF|nr:Energy-coupling factor transporter ATP-binding protein EcfA2 [Pseudomonas syringae pv. actinidiae]
MIRRRDVALRLQRTQGFAHRHPADLKGISNGLLREPLTRFKSSVHDGCAQRFLGSPQKTDFKVR